MPNSEPFPGSDHAEIQRTRQQRQRHGCASAIRLDLEQRLLEGSLLPGQQIDEEALARKFGVSRTPVREALLQLAAIDWVQFQGGRRAVVTPIPLQRIVQMFDVEVELEALCAKLAAESMSGTERLALVEAVERCIALSQSKETDPADYFDANQLFHELIYRGSHNAYLCETATALNHRLSPYRRFRLLSPARIKVSAREHKDIADAVIDGLAAKASLKMRTHMTIQSALLSEFASHIPASYLDATGCSAGRQHSPRSRMQA